MGPIPARRAAHAAVYLGVVEGLGAALWCLGGAGIYGSPLAGMGGEELLRVWAFLLAGPFSILPAAVVGLRRPTAGSAWLLAGGALSGALALTFSRTDASVLPLVLCSLPMLGAGAWLLILSKGGGRKAQPQAPPPGLGRTADELLEFQQATDGEGFFTPSVRPPAQADATGPGELGGILLGVALFLAGLVGTYALFIVLATNNVTGLRGEAVAGAPWASENENVADFVVLTIVAGGAALITLSRAWTRLPWALLTGLWLALLAAGVVILVR